MVWMALLVSWVLAADCRTLAPPEQTQYCEALGLVYDNNQCCGESASWFADHDVAMYTLVNHLLPIDNPFAAEQFCRMWQIEGFSWNTQDRRYLCYGQASGSFRANQMVSEFSLPVAPMAFSPEEAQGYCQSWGIGQFAWISGKGVYECVGTAAGSWLPDVNQQTYQLPTTFKIERPEDARDYCESWGFRQFAFDTESSSYTCLGASSGMWKANTVKRQYTLPTPLETPESAKDACLAMGFGQFAFIQDDQSYGCLGQNRDNWYPDGICRSGTGQYSSLQEAKTACAAQGFSAIEGGYYRCCLVNE